MRVIFLGTAAARPTVGRNVSSLAVRREGDLLLFDCGEGTQRQMMRYGTGFAVDAIFVTHVHADHFLGIIGLLRTLGLQGRREAVQVYGPPGSRRTLEAAVHLGVDRVTFPVEIHEVSPGDAIPRDGYDVVAVEVAHGVSAVGWALKEHDRLGHFDVDRARELGVPEGPLFGRLHRGETVDVDGRTVVPGEVVGPPRPGRKVVYTGDTLPCEQVVRAARDADLLVHDATFGEDEADRARDTAHATAAQAAAVGLEAGVHRLALTHLSARYADSPGVLEEEARGVRPGTVIARDGMVIEIPYRTDADGPGGEDASDAAEAAKASAAAGGESS